ncbi:MAG: hypothetical protein ABF676_07960 [Schleiferilactobacillus harbinensis]|uniref:hypothetical protein n=1 Tax=Schleiferilactobacillus harbinensis TaxID=304207 RepID=UPI0039E7D2B1
MDKDYVRNVLQDLGIDLTKVKTRVEPGQSQLDILGFEQKYQMNTDNLLNLMAAGASSFPITPADLYDWTDAVTLFREYGGDWKAINSQPPKNNQIGQPETN